MSAENKAPTSRKRGLIHHPDLRSR